MITYTGPLFDRTTGVDDVRDFLTRALADGRIVLDPRGRILSSELYAIYRTYHPVEKYMGINKFGTALELLGSPAVTGTAGVRYRGGIRTP